MQAVIKVIENNDRDKWCIKNWRFLLNVDTKILSRIISNKLKAILPTFIFSQQTAYVKYRFFGEGGRLISHITQIGD